MKKVGKLVVIAALAWWAWLHIIATLAFAVAIVFAVIAENQRQPIARRKWCAWSAFGITCFSIFEDFFQLIAGNVVSYVSFVLSIFFAANIATRMYYVLKSLRTSSS